MQKNYQNTATDSYGYLRNTKDWNEEIAKEIAKNEGITLTKSHWEIIYFLRHFYETFKMLPTMRIIVKIVQLKHGKIKGNSRYIFNLFPKNSPTKIATKIAGLPKPHKCL